MHTHECTEDELGLSTDRTNSSFYPIQKDFVQDAKRFLGIWHCFDQPELLNLYGTYDGSQAQHLVITLEQCNQTTGICETVNKDELLGNKFIAILMNERLFDPTDSKNIVKKTARITWMEIQTHIPME